MNKCAIYTRVSTDNQAEKEYNSCQSQEEKIRAYISSQNDWEIYDVFSDEGFTGANVNRPAFQRLLSNLDNIDVIVFYKLDRLTRSPKDFYRLVELFEKNKVDFISITEHYDTSTPSGRLLMNIMLTFAAFEREITSERTKDKMIQRAENGYWNGGTVPFGYDNVNNFRHDIDNNLRETVATLRRFAPPLRDYSLPHPARRQIPTSHGYPP